MTGEGFMKTRYISAIVALSGGAIAAIVNFVNKTPTSLFLKNVFLGLLVFWMIGYITERIIAKTIAPAASRDELEVFEDIEEVIRREEEYDEKYNKGKKKKVEVKQISIS